MNGDKPLQDEQCEESGQPPAFPSPRIAAGCKPGWAAFVPQCIVSLEFATVTDRALKEVSRSLSSPNATTTDHRRLLPQGFRARYSIDGSQYIDKNDFYIGMLDAMSSICENPLTLRAPEHAIIRCLMTPMAVAFTWSRNNAGATMLHLVSSIWVGVRYIRRNPNTKPLRYFSEISGIPLGEGTVVPQVTDDDNNTNTTWTSASAQILGKAAINSFNEKTMAINNTQVTDDEVFVLEQVEPYQALSMELSYEALCETTFALGYIAQQEILPESRRYFKENVRVRVEPAYTQFGASLLEVQEARKGLMFLGLWEYVHRQFGNFHVTIGRRVLTAPYILHVGDIYIELNRRPWEEDVAANNQTSGRVASGPIASIRPLPALPEESVATS